MIWIPNSAYLFTVMFISQVYGGQRLCDTNARICTTGLCPIPECLQCDEHTAICTTTNPKELVPSKLSEYTKYSVEITYEGPPVELEAFMFRKLSYLRSITITGKNIISVAPGTFVNQEKLKELIISGTRISQLPDKPFYPDNTLNELSMPFNQFTQFPVNMFPEIMTVQKMDFSYNPLIGCSGNKSTIDVEFQLLKNLERLTLKGFGNRKEDCRLLNKDYLQPLQQIQAIDLSESLIFYAEDPSILSPLIKVTSLTINNVPPFRDCPALAKDLFHYLPEHLSYLIMQKWSSTAPANASCFLNGKNLFGLKQLKKLSFFDTRYSDKIFGNELTQSIFDGFPDIHTLYVGWCGISFIEEGAFDPLTKLVDLILSGNLLGPRTFSLYSKNITVQVKILNLIEIGVNSATYDLSRQIDSFPLLSTLFLDKNLLVNVPVFENSEYNLSASLLPRTTVIKRMTIDENHISNFSSSAAEQICRLMPLLSSFQMESNRLTDITGICVSIRTLSFANNLIGKNLKDNFDALAKLSKLRHLDLSNNLIDYLPESLFANMGNLGFLNVAQNTLMSISTNLLMSTPLLAVLDLSSNFLPSVEEAAIENLHELRYLYFQDNAISSISAEFMFRFSTIFPHMNGFALAGNPLECSCNKHLKDWILNSTNVMQVKDITCRPPEETNKSVTTPVIDYIPDKFYCLIRTPLLITGTLIAGIIVSLIFAIPCYKHRWYIRHCRLVFRAIVHRIIEVKFEQQCKYDALISYNSKSDSDTEWVVQQLVPAVEKVEESINNASGKKPKLFIADRDSELGASTYEELCETVKNSRKIIILLSNSYLSSSTCLHQAAFLAGTDLLDNSQCYQPDRILLICLEELNEDIIVSPISSLLTSNATVIDISDYQNNERKMKRVWKKVKNFISTPKYVYRRKDSRRKAKSTSRQLRSSANDDEERLLAADTSDEQSDLLSPDALRPEIQSA